MPPTPPSPVVAPPARDTGRDRFLDLLRAAALVRVVLWHATGWAVITLVTAMPTMFFVSGSLYAGSLDRRGAWRTTVDRFRRFLVPLWSFAAVAWAVAVATNPLGDLHWSNLWTWVLPLGDPTGPADADSWWSSPLWYLRALSWVLLAAPLLRQLVRRRPRLVLLGLVAAVAGFEVLQHTGALRPSWDPRLSWHLGDLALYGGFFSLGMWHQDGGLARLGPRAWATVGGACAMVAALWWAWRPPATGVVNDVQTLHLLAGAAWLALALAAQAPLRALADRPAVTAAVRRLSRRSVTVYLWHSAVLAGALALVRAVGPADVRWVGAFVVVAGVGLAAAVAVAGWSEDVGAGRRPTWWPATGRSPAVRRSRLGVAAAVAAVLVALVVPVPGLGTDRTDPAGEVAGAGAFRPRVPSQAPPLPVIGVREADLAGELPATADLHRPLGEVVASWAQERGLRGLSVAVSHGRHTEAAVTGVDDHDAPRDPGTPIDVMSVTKLFTANLVYREVDAGRIALDEPLPSIASLPDLPLAGRVTVRQLLSHRSGLADYRDVPAYRYAPFGVASPDEAVRITTADDAWSGPASAHYSSTNYLVLGYLLEQVTGRSYDDLLRTEILEPLGLERTVHLPPEPGEPRFSTAGIVADIDELARAGWALLREHVGVSDESYRAMTAVDGEANMGAGTMSYCPCAPVEDEDRVEAFAVGYTGGTTWLAYAPAGDVVIAIDVTGGVHNENWPAVAELVQVLAARPPAFDA